MWVPRRRERAGVACSRSRPATSTDPLSNEQHRLLTGLVVAELVGLGLSVLLGALLAKRAMSPLVTAMDRQRRFVADASHELRTPVAALVTTAEVALRHSRDAEGYRKTVETCLSDARLLRRLVERLMEQCRADTLSHDEPASEVDLTPLLKMYEADEAGDMPYPPDYPKMPGEPKRVQPSRDRDRPKP